MWYFDKFVAVTGVQYIFRYLGTELIMDYGYLQYVTIQFFSKCYLLVDLNLNLD